MWLELLDKAMKSFGMPVGPITLSDEVGVDISKHVGDFMSKADLGDRMVGGDPDLIGGMVENGWLGRKAGKGFYMYPAKPKKGAKKELNPEMLTMLKGRLSENGVEYGKSPLSMEDIEWRLIGKFVNEAAYCLQDEIVRGPQDGDIGAVFGVGFLLIWRTLPLYSMALYSVAPRPSLTACRAIATSMAPSSSTRSSRITLLTRNSL